MKSANHSFSRLSVSSMARRGLTSSTSQTTAPGPAGRISTLNHSRPPSTVGSENSALRTAPTMAAAASRSRSSKTRSSLPARSLNDASGSVTCPSRRRPNELR